MSQDALKRLEEIAASGQKPDAGELLRLSRSLQRSVTDDRAVKALGQRLRKLMAGS